MRVVVDTNVLVGEGFRPDSAAGWIVRGVLEGRFRMLWTDEIRDEVETVVGSIPPLSSAKLMGLFRAKDRTDPPPSEDRLDWIPDPADRKFAALARDEGATLVSNDRHLLESRSKAGFEILTSFEFWRRWSQATGSTRGATR